MKRFFKSGILYSDWIIYWVVSVVLFTMFLPLLSNSDGHIGFLNKLFWFINTYTPLFGFYSFYFLIFKSIKKLNSNKIFYKILKKGFLICFIIGLISSVVSLLIFVYYLPYQNAIFFNNQIKVQIFISLFIFNFFLSLIHGILGLFMRLFFDWFIINKEKEALTEQNHQIEMELVKAQLNPHFLFNSLNNIDVLIHKDQEKASDFLNRLSDIMRYMLFDAKTEKVRFETEFHFIEKYVSLHQLRASNSDYVTIQNKVANTDGFIASLVFIPFIENAFKYASSFKTGNAIQIEFIEEQHTLRFICKNRIATESGDLISSNGLGNQLLKKRLDLIYKETYTLNIQEENEYFCVDLTIPYEAN